MLAFRSLTIAAWMVAGLVASLPGEEVDRRALDASYRAELHRLAERCDELGLPEEGTRTRAWFVERLPDRQYFFIPPSRAEAPPAEELAGKWHARWMELRSAQAKRLFALAERYLAAGDATRSYQALHEALREDPNHAEARGVLGYRLADGVWRMPGGSTGARKGTVGHAYLKDFRAGTYWRVNTPHFQIVTSTSAAAGQEFGERLEMLHQVWRQAFFRFWSHGDELAAHFAAPQVAPRPKKAFEVVLFKSREEYLANLSAAEPRLAVTQGFYSDQKGTAYFYAGDERALAICYHEVTHQLFQESGRAARDVGARGNFWLVEGIALYMESLRSFERGGQLDHVTLGGWDADRLQYARHHVFNGRYQLPLDELNALTREALQARRDIKRIYSQSAGLAHFLMDGDQGRLREPTVTLLAGMYAGRDDAGALAQLTKQATAELDAGYRNFLQVTDRDLLALDAPERVRSLALGHQPISDAGLAAVAKCENLQWLDLAATGVTDRGLAALAGLRRLDQLNLEQTAAGDATLTMLAALTQLRELDLSHTRVTDAGAARLAGLTELEVLWLTGTRITDASQPALARLTKLTTLDLEGTSLTPDTITRLRAALPALTADP